MESLTLSIEDVVQHVVTFGLDVYPPIEIASERTRLNMFYETVRERWPEFYEALVASDREFRISKSFRKDSTSAGPGVPFDTFILTNRGPVFAFPLRLPAPVADTRLKDEYVERFAEARAALWSVVPGRTLLRVGVVREVVFGTGSDANLGLLADQSEWQGARLSGGECLLGYTDDKCNILLRYRTIEIRKSTRLPIGAKIDQREGYGLQVILDVNNREVRPLVDADIEEVIARAVSFWEQPLLNYFKRSS